ncbi:MAG: hypothetical protein WC449_03280 [Candidatus Paceibacterota bacterium]
MTKKINSDTRFYIDVDIKKKKVIGWNYGSRYELEQELASHNHRRIFITKGQYNKLKR